MTVAGMAAAHVGARCTTGISPHSLKLALGLLMIAVSPLLPLREKITSRGNPNEEGTPAGLKAEASETGKVSKYTITCIQQGF